MPIARLEDFSKEEKNRLSSILVRKLYLSGSICMAILLVCIALLVYFNNNSQNFRVEENLGTANVVFVIIIVICGRLFVSEIMDYYKEVGASQKKVIFAKIGGRKDGKIVLGNKSFGKNEMLLDVLDFDSLKEGDDVKIELSAKSNRLFSVKKA